MALSRFIKACADHNTYYLSQASDQLGRGVLYVLVNGIRVDKMQYWRSEHLIRGDSERGPSWVRSKITSKKPIEIQQTNKGSNKEKKDIKKRIGTPICFSLLPSVSPCSCVLSPALFLSLSLIPAGGEGQETMGSEQQRRIN